MRGSKHMRTACALLAVVVLLAIPANCQSCKGRPTGVDLQRVTNLVKEYMIENSFWIGDRPVPKTPTQLIIGISPTPVRGYGFNGANVVVIVPAARDISLWEICGNEFSNARGGGLGSYTLAHLKHSQFRSFFENGGRTVKKTVKLNATPNFGPMDKWKEKMLDKIEHVLMCFLLDNGPPKIERSALTFQISNFNKKTSLLYVAIPELNEFWEMNFTLNSDGRINGVLIGREHRLTSIKRSLLKRLHDNSFIRRVETKCATP